MARKFRHRSGRRCRRNRPRETQLFPPSPVPHARPRRPAGLASGRGRRPGCAGRRGGDGELRRAVPAGGRSPAPALAAALEAAIPDAAALVFACLGVALALHGRRAVRARLLNGASAGRRCS